MVSLALELGLQTMMQCVLPFEIGLGHFDEAFLTLDDKNLAVFTVLVDFLQQIGTGAPFAEDAAVVALQNVLQVAVIGDDLAAATRRVRALE